MDAPRFFLPKPEKRVASDAEIAENPRSRSATMRMMTRRRDHEPAFHCVWMVVIVIAAFMLYMVKYQVQSLKTQIAETSRQLEEEKESLHVVAAEWAYLNRPERLRQLAAKYLPSSDLTVDQIADIEAIPFPGQTQASHRCRRRHSSRFPSHMPAAGGNKVSRQSRKVIIKESTGRRIIEQSRVRLLCVGLFFLLCFISISVRMVDVAVIHNKQAATITVTDPDNDEKTEQVELQQQTEPVLTRGDIVDRNGVLIATSLMTASVFVNPKEIKDKEEAAATLGKAFGMDSSQLLARFKSGKSFLWIKRNLTPKEQQAVNSLGIPGLYFLPEEKRVYPYGNMFSHVVGYVGIDNKGLAGIEKQFDSRLRDTALNREPVALSIDVRLQAIMHEEMDHAMNEFHAIGATGVIMDLKTGELLSMLSLPDFDPQQARQGRRFSAF